MAGKTTKPLKILVDSSLRTCVQLEELAAKGHEIWEIGSTLFDAEEADLILGPRCWRMTPELLKYLPDAVKAAREQVYGTKYK